jgi:DNA-directed RNA polymerase subunit RPC12/RpoP
MNTNQGSQVRLVIADKVPCATCGKEVYAEKVPYVCHDCWKNGKAGEAIAKLEAALKRIDRATIEWDANKLGSVHVQRKRWQRCGEIARQALEVQS